MQLDIKHDRTMRKFYADVDGREAYLRYKEAGPRTLDYLSTYVPQAQRHRGVGEAIVKFALEHARDVQKDVIPSCSFVRWVVDRNPAYQPLLVP